MHRQARGQSRSDCLKPTDLHMLENVLDFIAEDHLREREICAELDRIATSDDILIADVERSLSFLREELPLHLADEEEDLFPLMRLRCPPEDEIDKALRRLLADHRHADEQTGGIVAILTRLWGDEAHRLTAAEQGELIDYAAHARRHLILENAIILPLARVRLTSDDLETLRQGMVRRRGLI